LGVPVSTRYARRSRKPSRRELAERQLLVEIEAARTGRRRVYGARKTSKELRRRDVEAGRDQVARVMREHVLVGKLRRSKKRTTIPDEAAAERARDPCSATFPQLVVGSHPAEHVLQRVGGEPVHATIPRRSRGDDARFA
jgi:transposase InsO family protein